MNAPSQVDRKCCTRGPMNKTRCFKRSWPTWSSQFALAYFKEGPWLPGQLLYLDGRSCSSAQWNSNLSRRFVHKLINVPHCFRHHQYIINSHENDQIKCFRNTGAVSFFFLFKKLLLLFHKPRKKLSILFHFKKESYSGYYCMKQYGVVRIFNSRSCMKIFPSIEAYNTTHTSVCSKIH